MNLKETLEWLYKHEINVSVSSFWDGGWTFRLGDEINGFKSTDGPYHDLEEGARWLLSEAKRLCRLGDK